MDSQFPFALQNPVSGILHSEGVQACVLHLRILDLIISIQQEKEDTTKVGFLELYPLYAKFHLLGLRIRGGGWDPRSPPWIHHCFGSRLASSPFGGYREKCTRERRRVLARLDSLVQIGELAHGLYLFVSCFHVNSCSFCNLCIAGAFP